MKFSRQEKFHEIFHLYVYARASGEGMVKHYHIRTNDAGQYYIADSHMFDTLPELVVHHKHQSSGENFIDSNYGW